MKAESNPTKKLKLDLAEVASAMENGSWELDYYLDLETGAVVMVSDEIRRELEEIYQEFYRPEQEETFNLAEILQQRDLPEWHKQALLESDQVEQGYGTRYLAIPHADSHQGYHDMEDFIFTVSNRRLQDRLGQAIEGRGAFRRFKDVLASYPHERERWFAFKDERIRQRVLDWLESAGIEPVTEPIQDNNS